MYEQITMGELAPGGRRRLFSFLPVLISQLALCSVRLITAVNWCAHLACYLSHSRLSLDCGQFLTKRSQDDAWQEQRSQGVEQVPHPQHGCGQTWIRRGRFDGAAHVPVEQACVERSLPLSTWIAQFFLC